MKISKKAVLTTGSAFMLAGLGLMFVSAADKDLFVDPNNAIQHFVQVKIIARDLSDNSSAVIHKQGKMIGIETDYNFILSQTGDNLNKISVGVRGSSILGGIKNVISGGKYNGILGGEANEILTGTNNAILGGKSNSIFGKESVILGGEANEITSGSYSSIVGGNGNSVSRSYAVAVGENNEVVGYNSVAMGSGSKLMATSSFLWTDGNHSDELTGDHVFAVMGDNGMIVNAEEAHDLAQLTVGGSLVVYEDENAPICNNETKGALKVITGDSYNKYQKCFCSCDGSGWNALHEGTRCATLCTNTYDEVNAECGGVELICTNPYTYTGSSSGACIQGKLLEGTGAFLLGSQIVGNSLVHYINRSCQAADGKVVSCKQEMTGESCPNKFTMYYECLRELPEHAIGTTTKPGNSASPWKYDLTGYNDGKPCTYICDEYSERDPLTESCVPYGCTGVLSEGAELNSGDILPTNSTTEYEYDPDDYSNACKYHCIEGYQWDSTAKKCVPCGNGEIYIDGECKVVCDMSRGFDTITVIDNDGYAITIADRNLGATDNNISEPGSYGCYFQWGNNYGFQPLGEIKTGGMVNAASYGPSTYSSDTYVVSTRPDGDWSTVPNDNLWGGEGDSPDNYFGTRVTLENKVQRQGPCPEGWHVPSIGEWSDLYTIWDNKVNGANGGYVKDGGKIITVMDRNKVEAFYTYFKWAPIGERGSDGSAAPRSEIVGGSYWASSSPWLAGSLQYVYYADVRPNNANSFDYTVQDSLAYVGHGAWGTKGSGQGVRCFKDVPECPSGREWDQTELKCKQVPDCDMDNMAIQDLDMYILGSTGNISHYVMMDRNLGATQIYNQNYVSSNKQSFGCYFQWGNNYPFHRTGREKTEEQADVSGYGPNNYFSRDKYFCNRSGNELNRFKTNVSGWENLRGGDTNTDISKKGPCPTGYHVPHSGELQKLIDEWKSATNAGGRQLAIDMLTPFAGGISPRCNKGHAISDAASFWAANPGTSRSTSSICHLSLGNYPNGETLSCRVNSAVHAFPVRCVKNGMTTTPKKVTIHANGGTGAVISIDWETTEKGKIVSISEPKKNDAQFLGWYSDASFTTIVNTGSFVLSGGHLYARWGSECDVQGTEVKDLEAFFISSTGSITHYTMMDRNLGATEVFNQNTSSQNAASYGCYFQWGNIYGFNKGRAGNAYFSETLQDPENYGPRTQNGYYNNSRRFCINAGGNLNGVDGMYPKYNDDVPKNLWLWGGGFTVYGGSYQVGSDGIDTNRQGPCPDGYHIPRGKEMADIIKKWGDSSNYPKTSGDVNNTDSFKLQKSKEFASDLLLPFAGVNDVYCPGEGAQHLNAGVNGNYLISDYYYRISPTSTDGKGGQRNHLKIGGGTYKGIYLYLNGPAHGMSMRCVKNDISANQKVTVYPDGGTGAVITIDWETTSRGKIVKLGEPTKAGYVFAGWYTNTGFTNRVNESSVISAGSGLYAKWNAGGCDVEGTKVQDLEVFFLSNIGDITHYMMMDRNLGAIGVYNQNYNSPNRASYGCYFQWGNNYGFPNEGNVTTSSTHVDASAYGPGNYYSNSTFILGSSVYRWDTTDNKNLWGGQSSTVTDKQGPCPSGYHVPSNNEWINTYEDWNSANIENRNNGSQWALDLLIPFAGSRSYSSSNVSNLGTKGNYWSSTSQSTEFANALFFSSTTLTPRDTGQRASAYSVRCFKNSNNQKATVHPDGGTGAVIAIDWETTSMGKIVRLGEPKKAGYTFGGWYLDSGFNDSVYESSVISAGSGLYAKWTADNLSNQDDTEAKDLDVYFLKSDGSVAHDTLMDRNLGATEIYNQNYANPNKASYGYHYQWGNNYGFPSEGDVATSLFQVDASGYGPGRYYSNGMFIAKSAGFTDWSSVQNDNLWGGSGDYHSNNWGYDTENNTAINVTWRQGPCPAGYHVPSKGESLAICNNWNNANTVTTNKEQQLASDLLLPFAGLRSSKSAVLERQGSQNYWSSTTVPNGEGGEAFILDCNDTSSAVSRQYRAYGLSVRCFKNSDNSHILTIHPNEGTNAVIAVDGNVITALGEPIRTGYTFGGWYTDSDYNYRVYKGDTISNESHLYAKWNSNTVVVSGTAMFETGDNFNSDVKGLARATSTNVPIVAVVKVDSIPSGVTTKIVSSPDSELPIYAWYNGDNGGTMYYYTQASKIYLNPDSSYMFANFSKLTDIDVSIWDTTKVKDMSWMFAECSSLVGLNVTNWNTSKVEDMNNMFDGCSKLVNLNVSNWETSKVTDMEGMFLDCSSLTSLNLRGWNTSLVENMSAMFKGCNKLTNFDVSNWNVGNVTDMNGMFRNCSSITSLNLSGWNTSLVEDMREMFAGCTNLVSINVSNWDTTSVKHMGNMFNGCSSLTFLDISTWDTTNNKPTIGSIFNDCSKLEKICASEKFKIDPYGGEKINSEDSAFKNCLVLKGSAGTTYEHGKRQDRYARIDKGPIDDDQGYLSDCDASSAPKCRVDFDENGGNPDYTGRQVDCGDTVIMPTVIRSGYNLLGWYYGSWRGDIGSGYTVMEDTLFRAGWDTGFYCVGPTPQNAELVEGSNVGLAGDTPNRVYENAASARGQSCAYLCKEDFVYVVNYGVPQCVQCEDGTYDAVTQTCQITVGCKTGYVYGPSNLNSGGYACLRLGNCRYNEDIYDYMPDSNGKPVDFKDAQPIGTNDKYRRCVEGTPSNYQCQYQCNDDSVCRNGVCESLCPPKDTDDFYLVGHPTWRWKQYGVMDNANYTKVGNGGTEWQHVNKLSDLNDSTPDGCYFDCKEGTYYGTSVFLNGGVLGCLNKECEPLTYYRPLIDTGITITGGKPSEYHQKYEFVDDISLYKDKPGCYYSCAEQYRYRMNLGQYRACITTAVGVTDICPQLTANTGSTFGWSNHGLDNNVNISVVGHGGTGWQHVDSLDDLNGSTPDGCYFECKEGTYYGPYPGSRLITGCIAPSCPSPSEGGLYSTTYGRSLRNLTGNANYKMVGNGGTGWQYVDSLDDLDDSTPDGCYFECKEGTYYGPYPGSLLVTGCLKKECAPLPDYANDTSIVSTGGKQDKYYTGWTFVDDLSSYRDQDGCFYTCDKQYRYYVDAETRAIGCKKNVTDDDRCPSKEHSGKAYEPTYLWGVNHIVNNANYQVVGAGGFQWERVNSLSGLNDSTPDGCYFACKKGTYYGRSDWVPYSLGCLEKKCDSLPSYANNTTIVSTGGKPSEYRQGWTFVDNLSSYMDRNGCYYTCAEQYRYDADGGTGCAITDDNKCPKPPYYWNYSSYGTHGIPDENKKVIGNGGTKWVYKEDLTNITEENGCFYTCRESEVYSGGYEWGMCQEKKCMSIYYCISGTNASIVSTGGRPALYNQKWSFVSGDISSYMNRNGCYFTCEQKYRIKVDGVTKCEYKECKPRNYLDDDHLCKDKCPLECGECGWSTDAVACIPNEYNNDCSSYGDGWSLVNTNIGEQCVYCLSGTHWTENGCQ